MTGFDSLDVNAQAQPPDGELAQAIERVRAGERGTPLSVRMAGQLKSRECALEDGEGVGFLSSGQRLATDECSGWRSR